MGLLAIGVTALLACGGTEISELAQSCIDVAERYCCAGAAGQTDDGAEICAISITNNACRHVGDRIRSSVDFAACNAALDAEQNLCARTCGIRNNPNQPCFEVPAQCKSASCEDAADGCAEAPDQF